MKTSVMRLGVIVASFRERKKDGKVEALVQWIPASAQLRTHVKIGASFPIMLPHDASLCHILAGLP
jgi:hypothetical protein